MTRRIDANHSAFRDDIYAAPCASRGQLGHFTLNRHFKQAPRVRAWTGSPLGPIKGPAAKSRSRVAARVQRTLTALAVAACVTFGRAGADPGDMPNARLTPGVVASENVPVVCRSGYSRSVRPAGALWRRLKDEAYNRYGLPRGQRSEIDAAGHRHAAFTIDHLFRSSSAVRPATFGICGRNRASPRRAKTKSKTRSTNLCATAEFGLRPPSTRSRTTGKQRSPIRCVKAGANVRRGLGRRPLIRPRRLVGAAMRMAHRRRRILA